MDGPKTETRNSQTLYIYLNAGWSQWSENVKKNLSSFFPCIEYTFFHADSITIRTQLKFYVYFVNLHYPEKSDSRSINCQSLHEVSELSHLHHQKIWLTIASSA